MPANDKDGSEADNMLEQHYSEEKVKLNFVKN